MLSEYLFQIFLLLIFAAAVLLVYGISSAWDSFQGPQARRLKQRLRALSSEAARSQEALLVRERFRSGLPLIDRVLASLPRSRSLEELLIQSGSKFGIGRFVVTTLVAGAAGLVLPLILVLPWPVAILGSVLGASLPFLQLLRARQIRLRKLEEQLPSALDLIGRALRAGHAFSAALGMVGEEATDPVRSEFRTVHEQINYGVPAEEALVSLSNRVPSTDLRYFVVAVLIQRETGGNLAELLDNISALIRERLKLYGRIRVLSAEGRLSAWILTLLPFILALIINLLHPKFMSVLWTDPAGLKMVGACLTMMALGILWMWRLVKIRV